MTACGREAEDAADDGAALREGLELRVLRAAPFEDGDLLAQRRARDAEAEARRQQQQGHRDVHPARGERRALIQIITRPVTTNRMNAGFATTSPIARTVFNANVSSVRPALRPRPMIRP